MRCVLFCIDAKKEQSLIYTMVSFLFCFTRYRPEKLFQKCIVADRMYVRPGFSMTMPSAHTVVAVDQYFLSNRLYALKEKVVGIFANSVSYVAPRSNLVHEDTFTLFPVSA